MSIGLARVTISAPQRRVDVALPEHTPLVELLPEVLRHAGEGLADDGERHGGWLLRRADGRVLTTAQGLFSQGVRDGEVLHLVPARDDWPELEYDDVVEAIAEGARRCGAVWTPDSTRTATLAGAVVLMTLGLLAVLSAGPAWGGAAHVGLGAAVVLALCGVTASRAYGDARAGAALGACAMPYGFAGGAALVATEAGDKVGAFGPLPWLAGPELLSGAVMLLLVAALGGIGVAAGLRVFAAGVTAALLAALTALADLLTDAAGAAAVLISVLVCGIGVLPLLAIRFGRMPTPPVTLPAVGAAGDFTGAQYTGAAPDAARDHPDRATVFAAVSRTEELLAGMLIGHAVLAAGAFVMLAAAGSLSGRILIAVSATALLLRSRLFVTVRQRVPLICAGLTGVAALGVDLLAGADAGTRLAVTAVGLLLALATMAAGATYSRKPPSPYLARAADLLDALVVVSVIPVACAVAGLYSAVGNIDFG
jgi:type VII secretion integral membrane protein EccD